ncbi:K02A2.6-like [Cordylochernes scorpioides]|uniref:K02A2.6-like n=1 Tax=Cordylochernes scorpioides TaxID=51811 RepID=A0ABY6L528_9ARAC|nr:K02A2.6-like [Cordylochernes scorpioides]
MRSCRLVIPASMKLEILDKLHAGQLRDYKNKTSRTVCIQEAVSKHEPLIPTNFPTRPWQKIGMDLFKFENKWYLVVIDYYSRFPEVIQLDRLTASVVVRSCKSIFARHGIPETVVSDNGTQFGAAREFANFARQYGFTHVTSSPRFPQSNGMAEAGVTIAMMILKKNQDPSLGLLEYRSTPLENGYSPAELLMGRKLRTTLPIAPDNLNPKLVDSQTLKRKEGRRRKDMKSRYDRRCGATDMEELSEVSMELPLVNVPTCELRSVIRFFTAKNETAVNIHRNLVSVYGEGCMSIQMVRRWRSWFLEGRQNVHDDERSDWPVTATDNAAVAAVRNVVEANRRVTIDEIMI